MEINEYLIKISTASIPIAIELAIGDDVAVKVHGSIVKVEDTDNQDGTINRTYVIKGVFTTSLPAPAKTTKSVSHSKPFKY